MFASYTGVISQSISSARPSSPATDDGGGRQASVVVAPPSPSSSPVSGVAGGAASSGWGVGGAWWPGWGLFLSPLRRMNGGSIARGGLDNRTSATGSDAWDRANPAGCHGGEEAGAAEVLRGARYHKQLALRLRPGEKFQLIFELKFFLARLPGNQGSLLGGGRVL